MRHLLVTSFALLATAGTIAAVPAAADSKAAPLTLTKLGAHWSGSTRNIFVDTRWTPKRFETRVLVKISVNGDPLRTLRVTHWVIGHKIFKLTVPASIAAGSKARIEVRVHSEAGDDRRSVLLPLP
ncbi:MAG: hypothetical protein M3Q31_17180 [Actinomycetota bacterium]|nr:hypothetical protein [Actinomycetota bacterium]